MNKEIIKTILDKEILADQTIIVRNLLGFESVLEFEDIENLYYYVGQEGANEGEEITVEAYNNLDEAERLNWNENTNEVLQWFLVTPWLADKLFDKGGVVIRFPNIGNWWGRTDYDQALEDDYVFELIAKEVA